MLVENSHNQLIIFSISSSEILIKNIFLVKRNILKNKFDFKRI